MKTCDIVEGIQILAKYRNKQGWDLGAAHDVIYCFATDKPVGAEDLQRLVDLGWCQEDADYDPGEGFKVENYDPEESWTAYV